MRRSITMTVATTWLVLLTITSGGGVLAAPQEAPTVDEARALMAEEQWDAAAEAWHAIVEEDPDNGGAWFQFAYCLLAADRIEEAIHANSKAASFDDYRGIALYNLGCAYARAGHADEAIEALAGAQQAGFGLRDRVGSDPDLASLRDDPRLAHLVASEPAGSPGWESLLQQAAMSAQRFWQKHGPEIEQQMQMYIQQFMQDLAPVLVQIQQKLAEDPRFAQIAQAMQQWMGGQGERQQAAQAPPAPPPLATPEPPAAPEVVETVTLEGAWQRLQAGRLEEALEAFRVLAKANPDQPEAHFGLAYCLHMMGDYKRAIEAHKRASKFEEIRGISLYNLACAYALTGKTEKALAALDASREAGFDVAESAASDSDLDSLRDDPHFKTIVQQ